MMVAVVAAVAVVIVAIGVATAIAMRSVVEYNFNESVKKAASLIRIPPVPLDGATEDAQFVLSSNVAQPGILLVVVSPAGEISAAYTDQNNVPVALSASTAASIWKGADGDAPAEVQIPSVDTYRVVPFTARAYSGLIGLPTSQAQGILTKMIVSIVTATLIGLLLVGALIAFIIRVGFRPLRKIEQTAILVAETPMDEGAVSLPERVVLGDAEAHSEVGRVAAAFNRLLDHVEGALLSRGRKEAQMRSFVADASHELRTPLASIRGYSELALRDNDLGDLPRESLARIHSQSLRMTSLVEDLLLLARLDEKEQELTLQPIDLGALVVESVSDVQATAPEHQWEVTLGGDAIVRGDPRKITQALTNVLANARTHTPPGTQVTVSLATNEPVAEVRIQDNGPGIDPSLAPRIFDRFARGDSSRTRVTGGSGLGLAITQAIIQAHGGTITLDSQPGCTSFLLSLPLAP